MFNTKIISTLLLLGSTTLFAEDIFSYEYASKINTNISGFHGTLGLSFYAASIKGYNDFGNFENKEEFQIYSVPVPNGYLSYTIDGFSVFSKIEINRGLGLGFTYGMFELYYVPDQKSLLLKFEDPLDKNSKSTSYDVHSFELSANNIVDTSLSLHYVYNEEQVKNDKNVYLSNLSVEDRASLQRSFKSHTFGVGLEDYIGGDMFIHANINYEKNTAKGKANSYDAYSAKVGMMNTYEQFFYGDVFSYKRAFYKEVNPIKNNKEQKNIFSNEIHVGYAYSENTSFYLSYTVEKMNSNINIYDRTTSFVNLGYSYDF